MLAIVHTSFLVRPESEAHRALPHTYVTLSFGI
jgi:hypothetical protein